MRTDPKQIVYLAVIDKVYEHQKYMYEKQSTFRIGQDHQYLPVVHPPDHQGKAASPVEFGAKMDISLDEKGLVRIEKYSSMPITKVMSSLLL